MAVMNETSTSQPGPQGPAEQQPRRSGTDGFFDSVRRLGVVRTDDRWIGGVAAGLARRFSLDPVVVRGLLAVSVLLGGIGLVLYGIAWLLLPEQSDGRIHAQQMLHGDVNIAVLGAVGAIVLGLSVPASFTPFFWVNDGGGNLGDWFRGLAWFAAITIILIAVVMAMRGRGTGTPPSTTLPGPGHYPPAPGVHPMPPQPGAAPSGTPTTPTPSDPAGAPTGGPMSTDTTSAVGSGQSSTHGADQTGTPSTTDPTYPASQGAPVSYGAPGGYGTPAGHGGYGGPGGPPAPGGYQPAPWQPQGPSTSLPVTERSGAGVVLGVVAALTLITLAALLYAERTGFYDGPVAATTLTVGLVLLGLGIAFQAVRDKGSGGLTAIAIVGLLVGVPVTAVAQWDGDWEGTFGESHGAVGEVTATPMSVATAENGVRVGAGTVDLDLTEVPLGNEPVVVPVRMGAGELTVTLPDDVSVSAEVALGAGEVTWLDGETVSGAGNEARTYLTDEAKAGEPVQIELDIQVGLGTVTVEED